MRALYEQVARPKSTFLFLALGLSTLVLSLFSHSVFADDTTNQLSDPGSQTGTATVQSPGMPSATSSASNHTIVWVWTAPAGGLTPDASAVASPTTQTIPSADSTQTQLANEQPTDIIQYGYELSKQGAVITSGIVNADTPTVTTMVTEDGDYVFKVWSVTRIAAISAPAIGGITIATPAPDPSTLPPIGNDIIPAPLNTAVLEKPTSSTSSTTTHPLLKPSPASKISSQPSASDVLAASDTKVPVTPIEKITGVVTPSTQGWMIFNIAWYVWLIVLAAIFIVGRWVIVTRRRAVV